MDPGIAGIGDIAAAVGVDGAGGGLAGTVCGSGEGPQAARQTTDTASPRILPLIACIRVSPTPCFSSQSNSDCNAMTTPQRTAACGFSVARGLSPRLAARMGGRSP